MADKLVTVRPSGGTYTTLAAAITGELSANADIVTMAGILSIQIEGDWSGGADTTAVNIAGFTTSALYYVNIITDSANRAGTSWSDSKYRLVIYNDAISSRDGFIRFTGLQISCTRTGSYAAVWGYAGGVDCIFDSCFIKSLANSNIYDMDRNVFRNCILLGGVTSVYLRHGGTTGATGASVIQNCIMSKGTLYGVNVESSLYAVIKNSYSGNNGGDDYYGYGTITLTTSFSEDGTKSTSTEAYSTATFTNVTSGSEDFSIPVDSGLIDVGTDLSADAIYPFDWDITGATRSGTWDVGAYEYVTSGAVDLAGVITATSTATGALSVSKTLSGSASSASTISGVLLTPKNLSGTIVSVSTVTGAITVSKTVSGSIVAQSIVSGNLQSIKYLSGSINAVSSATADLSTMSGLSGSITCQSSASGSLFVSKYLSGIVSTQSLITGNIQVNKYLSAILTAQSTASGTLSGGAVKPGIAHITFLSKTNMMTLSGKSNMTTMMGKQNANTLTGKANNITMGVGDD
jgi:hypothetical protein